MKIRKLLFMAAALTLGVQGAAAQADQIVYSLGDAELTYGTGGKNAETYDVALRLADPALVGARIKAVRIAFPFTDDLSNAKAWLSRELPAIKSSKAGEPDITSKAFDISTDKVEVVFDEPYTLTADGVYVGYSFDVAKVATAVEPVLTTSYTSPDGFYIHTTKIYRTAWRSLYPNAGQLAIEVVLEGDVVMGNAATVSYVPEQNIKTGEPTRMSFEVTNLGNKGIQSLDYSYELAGDIYEVHTDLAQPVPAIFGRWTDVSLLLPAVGQKGAYTMNITINKVNGVANEAANAEATGQVNVYNTLPRHRAVVEEYTGTWCGYCPRGFVGLEEMNRLFPDDFIGISYHNGDPMEIMSYSSFPWNPAVLGAFPGYPSCALDRIRETDAYCGDYAYGTFGIDRTWQQRCEVFAPASVRVASEWTDDNTLTATATVTFPLERDDCPYEIGFVLTQDGMTGEGSSWRQSNYYSGEEGWPESMDQFTQGASYVDGLVFNDVIVARSGAAGIEGSLTAPIEADVAQQYSYAFRMDEVVNTDGDNIVQDKQQLRVIALLIDRETGEIINANKAMAGQDSDVATAIARTQDDVTATIGYYDLLGRRVSRPASGLFIRQETLRSGHVRTSKVQF